MQVDGRRFYVVAVPSMTNLLVKAFLAALSFGYVGYVAVEYKVFTDLLKCDYISYLETGKPEFYGEYMTQYSWAEETCAMLQFKK